MNTHNNGPWENPGCDDGGEVIAYRDTFGKRRTIAHVYGASRHGVQKANARLIAAAPDLLEACQRFASIPCERHGNIHCTMLPRDSGQKDCPPCAIRAAVAKATGTP